MLTGLYEVRMQSKHLFTEWFQLSTNNLRQKMTAKTLNKCMMNITKLIHEILRLDLLSMFQRENFTKVGKI